MPRAWGCLNDTNLSDGKNKGGGGGRLHGWGHSDGTLRYLYTHIRVYTVGVKIKFPFRLRCTVNGPKTAT